LNGEIKGRDLATQLYQMYLGAGCPPELDDFAGLDDWYDMLDQGVIDGLMEDVERAVASAT